MIHGVCLSVFVFVIGGTVISGVCLSGDSEKILNNLMLMLCVMCVYRFRPTTKGCDNFFLKMNGKPIASAQKEMDVLQKEFGLPYMTSSNARHVIETAKGKANLESSDSSGNDRMYLLLH